MTPQHKQKSIINLKKAQSLIGKMITMLEEDVYCINVMQQNLAVIGMLKSANQTLMEGHLQSCFKHAVMTANTKHQKEMVEEILKVSSLSNK